MSTAHSVTFTAIDPRTGRNLPTSYSATTAEQLEAKALAAKAAFLAYARTSGEQRAQFLNAIAAKLEAAKPEIVELAHAETALPVARLEGEVGRTTGQLRMFASLIQSPEWQDPRFDAADPQRAAGPKPDVRSLRRPVGPVAVFGASNFPLAFSVAGGDTASALAAGCPVIAKAHPAHPGTSQLVAGLILAAAAETGMPEGVFSLVMEPGFEIGQALVLRPEIKAVGFTGSRAGGEALMKLAATRPEPIPVYAEMGSVNPVFVTPGALAARSDAVAAGLFGSFTLGVGQFCTNPGVVLLPNGAAGDAFRSKLADLTSASEAGTMLTPGICKRYGQGIDQLRAAGGQEIALGKPSGSASAGQASVWEAPIEAAMATPALLSEVFGPSTLLLRYSTPQQLIDFASRLEGQLTATIHAEENEFEALGDLVEALAERSGRLIINQFPTGVEVSHAMVHGGPYPATSDGRSTSVGTNAIERFTRLIAYQNFPTLLLPAALQRG